MKWWDAEAIDKTVTRQFVCAKLLPDEITRLDQPLRFDDLTDDTYWGWISEKAKRLFLILVDIGMPDQIFGLIDLSWEDSDLPIGRDCVEGLALTRSKDEVSETKFYQRQFYYLLRPLQRGEHVLFQDDEVVLLDVIDRSQGIVVLPNEPNMVFCRRQVPLGQSPGHLTVEEFQCEVSGIRNIQHKHLVSYWASYVHGGYGYVLFTPVAGVSLKNFLATPFAVVKSMQKQARRRLVTNWIHCLVDALCFVHSRGLSHGNIKPSTILFTNDNNIFFSDFTRFNPALTGSGSGKASFDKESYDYAAPEQWSRSTSSSAHRLHTATPSAAASPDSLKFNISRSSVSHSGHNPVALMHAPTPHLDPQAADIFSLGCVILELLSFLVKKQGKPFAAHRAEKHKKGGRGGAVLDASFHENLSRVESWMGQLAREAAAAKSKLGRFKITGEDDDDERGEVAGMTPLLHVVEGMLASDPAMRPTAIDVQARMYRVLTEACGISEPHCVHQYGDGSDWDSGIGVLRLNSPPSTSAISTISTIGTISTTTGASTWSAGHGGFGMASLVSTRQSGSSSSLRLADRHRADSTSDLSGSSSAGTLVNGKVAIDNSVDDGPERPARKNDRGGEEKGTPWQAPVVYPYLRGINSP